MPPTMNAGMEESSSKADVQLVSEDKPSWELEANRLLDRVVSTDLGPSGGLASITVAYVGVNLLRKALFISLKKERQGGYLHHLLETAIAPPQKEAPLYSAMQRGAVAFDECSGGFCLRHQSSLVEDRPEKCL